MVPGTFKAISLLLSASSPLPSSFAPHGTTRRHVLKLTPALALALSVASNPAGATAALSANQGVEKLPGEIKLLTTKAKMLRGAVSSSAAIRRAFPLDPTPGVNNYRAITDAVKNAKEEVLLPLSAALAAAAEFTYGSLPPEKIKLLALQPLLMKGHLLELDQVRACFQPSNAVAT